MSRSVSYHATDQRQAARWSQPSFRCFTSSSDNKEEVLRGEHSSGRESRNGVISLCSASPLSAAEGWLTASRLSNGRQIISPV